MIVIGTGGLGSELVDGLLSGNYRLTCGSVVKNVFVYDDDFEAAQTMADSWDGKIVPLTKYDESVGENFVVAVGDPTARNTIYERALSAGLVSQSLVHNSAVVSKKVKFGNGCIIGPFTYVGPFATLGENVFLNTYSSVGHHAQVGKASVLSPYAALNGSAQVGELCFLGTHSVVSVGQCLGSHSKVASGSILTKNAAKGSLSVGNPAVSRVLFSID